MKKVTKSYKNSSSKIFAKRGSIAALLGAMLLSGGSFAFGADRTVSSNSGEDVTGSFRQVVADAETGDTIKFSGTFKTITLKGGTVNDEVESLSIIGNGLNALSVNGYHNQILSLGAIDGQVELKWVNYGDAWNFVEVEELGTSNVFTADGGAFSIFGTKESSLKVTDTGFSSSIASVSSEIDNNEETLLFIARGGAVYFGIADDPDSNAVSKATFTNATFLGNEASSYTNAWILDADEQHVAQIAWAGGGAVWHLGDTTFDKACHNQNIAIAVGESTTAIGGAFIVSEVTIKDTTMTLNSAQAWGESNKKEDDDDEDRIVTGSDTSATALGGGGYVGGIDFTGDRPVLTGSGGNVTITSSTINYNEAKAYGGAATTTDQVVHASGGAFYMQMPGDVVITNSSFLNNLVYAEQNNLSQSVSAEGGAITYVATVNETGSSNKFELVATEGKKTIFLGNAYKVAAVKPPTGFAGENVYDSLGVIGNENTAKTHNIYIRNEAIRFKQADDAEESATIDFNIKTDGLVALYDAITVDEGVTLNMNVSGSGEFRWGGENWILPGSQTNINLKSGLVTLCPNFTIGRPVANDETSDFKVTMADGLNLELNLTHRDQDLVFFQSPDSFTVTNKTNGDAGKVNLSAYSFLLGEFNGNFLITDARGDVDEDNFNVSGLLNRLFGVAIVTDDNNDNLYLKVNNALALKPFVDGSRANVASAMNSGALSTAFNKSMTALYNSNPALQEDVFLYFHNNPQLLAAESVATQAVISADTMRYFSQSLWQIQSRSSLERSGGSSSLRGQSGRPVAKANLWGGYLGNSTTQDDNAGYFGYNAKLNGGIFGIDVGGSGPLTLGFFCAFAKNKSEFESLRSNIDTNVVQFGLYGTLVPIPCLSVRTDISYGQFSNNATRRNIFHEYASSYSQHGLNVGVTAIREFDFNSGLSLSPYIGGRYIYLNQKDVNEGMKEMASSIHKNNLNSFATTVGTAVSYDFMTAGPTITPTLYADWRHEFGDTRFSTTGTYAGSLPTEIFTINSVERKRDSADLGLDLKTAWHDNGNRVWTVDLGYVSNFTAKYINQSYYATFGVKF